MRVRVAVVCALLVLTSLGAGLGISASNQEVGQEIDASVSVSRVNETAIQYHIGLAVSSAVTDLTISSFGSRTTFSSMDGFAQDGDSITWDGSNEPSFAATYSLSRNADSRCYCIATKNWSIVRPLYLLLVITSENDTEKVTLYPRDEYDTIGPDTTIEGEGVVGSGFLYFGDYQSTTAVMPTGTTIHITVPDAASGPSANASQRVRDLRTAAHLLDVGEPNKRELDLLIVPKANALETTVIANDWLRAGGATGSFLYIQDGRQVGTWFHEYTHHRQSFSTSYRTRWLTEGMATYYGHLLRYRGEYWSQSDFRTALNEKDIASRVVLNDPSTWGSRSQYRKGAVVVAYLDQRIREETGGNKTFVDVFRRLNRRDYVAQVHIKMAIAAVVGDDRLDDEFDRFVTTSATPTNHEYLYVVGEDPEIAVTPTATPTPNSLTETPSDHTSTPISTTFPNTSPGTTEESPSGASSSTSPGMSPVLGLLALGVLILRSLR